MSDAVIFVGLLLAILLVYMVRTLWGRSWRDYFATKDGMGILKGIVLAPIVILILAALFMLLPGRASAGTWLNDASVFAGLDYTRKLSPQCERNEVDERGTSNLGLRLNLWESDSRRVRLNSKYTHHSCALGPDDRQYDAVGVELEWRVWERAR